MNKIIHFFVRRLNVFCCAWCCSAFNVYPLHPLPFHFCLIQTLISLNKHADYFLVHCEFKYSFIENEMVGDIKNRTLLRTAAATTHTNFFKYKKKN